jgi:hypothetical protein
LVKPVNSYMPEETGHLLTIKIKIYIQIGIVGIVCVCVCTTSIEYNNCNQDTSICNNCQLVTCMCHFSQTVQLIQPPLLFYTNHQSKSNLFSKSVSGVYHHKYIYQYAYCLKHHILTTTYSVTHRCQPSAHKDRPTQHSLPKRGVLELSRPNQQT